MLRLVLPRALPAMVVLAVLFALAAGCRTPSYDLILSGGTVHDGSGGAPIVADLGIRGDRIAAIGDLSTETAERTLDVSGLVVAPGFVNVLSWAVESLIEDGRSSSDLRQGVTLEVFGEGSSWGPWNDDLKAYYRERQSDVRYDIEWTTLGEYLDWLAARGVAPNIASFVGATTVRMHEVGFEDRAPTPDELERMKNLVRQEMEAGALGVGSSLIYAPAFYAGTDELVELCKVAAAYDGLYITHLRSEGNRLLEAFDEFLEIVERSGIRGEVYHLKAAGQENWPKLEEVFRRIEAARARGLSVTADMYTYTAGATGLDAAMPPWVQEGGYEAWAERLRDPAIRARVAEEMRTPTDAWENLYLAAGSAENVLLVGFKNPALREHTGKSLAELAAARGTSPEETAMDLVVEDGSRVGTVYFFMSEENVRAKLRQPWVSFGSDAASLAPEGVFLSSNPHPRAYGNFARLLGRYVRDEGIISLEEAIRRLTSLPAENLRLRDRGRLKESFFADVTVFDAATIRDHATFDRPHQFSTGVKHVVINGVLALEDGEPTGALPGRVVRGPGWRGEP